MITDKSLSEESIKALRLAAIAQLAEKESRDKSRRSVYEIPASRYMEMLKFDEAFEPKELGHGFRLDIRKREIE